MAEVKTNHIDPLKDKSFLFVCLSYKWGERERKVISDILCAIEAGASVHLYVLRDSSLAIKAKELNIPVTYHQGAISISFIKWRKLKTIRKLMTNYSVDVVHCYSINVLWPLSYFLKSKPLIPLILSLVKPLRKSYRSFWYRPLSRRIDQVLVTHQDLSENVYGFLGILAPRMLIRQSDFQRGLYRL